jgi:anti-sigma factor RsiW
MECQELHQGELAEKYLNGQLDPATQDDFEVHILECARCLNRVEAMQTLREELSRRTHQIRNTS